MELREFAEQVLFATTLEDKLRPAGTVTDDHPGSPLAAPAMPGRPAELRFKPSGSERQFPGLHRLDQPRERGRLLHFFANHELLATELMALVLLRFPDAPPEFRRGVLRTLQEEQEHTRLYLDRMRACGIHFGELPVSGYFWRAVSGMQSPLDYVAGLSLTFEQANLDFARQFSRGFAAVGDTPTAQLLDRIYHDEIAHVAYGLKWFRRWKDPRLSDWDAFCHQLKFPLSPRRAKGVHLNVEGRQAAGLDPAFIDQLNVCAQSKGRTPHVFLFNPFAEAYLAAGPAFTPTAHQAALARDLASLPQFLCRQDDVVLVPERPSVPFLATLCQAGFPLPEFVETGHSPGPTLQRLQERKLAGLRPWAWGPDSVQFLRPLFASVTPAPLDPARVHNDGITRLYSKAWSADLLRLLLSSLNTPTHVPPGSNSSTWLCTPLDAGVAVSSLPDALAAIDAIRRRGHHRVVVKQALGLAGGNALRLWEPDLLESQRRWMAGALARGVTLVVEPWLERLVDFSLQLEMAPAGLKLVGYSGLLTDPRGQFRGNWADPGHRRRPPADALACFPHLPDIAARFHSLYQSLQTLLEAELQHAGYVGPVGIDSFVYRGPDALPRLKPVVEINPRYTMGRLTLELMRQVCPGTRGRFRLMSRNEMQAAGGTTFEAYARALTTAAPLRLEGDPVPRIREGALCLNDPSRAEVCLAVFEVARLPVGEWPTWEPRRPRCNLKSERPP